MPRICKLLMGLPSSGKRLIAQTREWASIYGISANEIKIANDDYDYDFSLYNAQGKSLVIIWNPAWIYDSEGLNDMFTDATNNGYTIEKEHFENDTVQTKCNAYIKYGSKGKESGNFAYYEFISKFIDNFSIDYEKYLRKNIFIGVNQLTAVQILDKGACKGGGDGGDIVEPCLKCFDEPIRIPCGTFLACDG